jgi:hypothetical protein
MEVAITMKTALAVWWAFAWRSFLFFLVVGGTLGFCIGFIGNLMGVAAEQYDTALSLLGVVLLLLAGPVFALHRMMEKGFGRYRLQIKLRES